MQIEVADVSPESSRPTETDLGIEIGSIEVDLPAVAMHHRTDLTDPWLEDTVRGGVGHHQSGETVAELLSPGRQIIQIDVPLVIAGHRHHLQARHHGAGGVGAMGTGGDQTDVPMAVPPRVMPGPDHQQAGVLPLRAGIGLKGDR